ncbi:hypothetical protein QLX08_004662 [Tetragonisca angustula]|uniref:Uncharacterized protein n=1 Tax=Tetragonisca angustula TaxID=166442 RepID=A0AAW1A1K1_9HYME
MRTLKSGTVAKRFSK